MQYILQVNFNPYIMRYKSPTSQAVKVQDFLKELQDDATRATIGEKRHEVQQFRQAIALLKIYLKQRADGDLHSKDKQLVDDIRNFLNESL